MNTTLLTHIFNEEYLLPFWLNHHKNMFDNLIVIDYNSTDNSLEICKNIWPECTIIKTRNKYFEAIEVDREVMDIENSIEGIKIVLNTTEFVVCETSLIDIFTDNTTPISYAINCVSPYSINSYNINNNDELFKNLLNYDVVYHYDRYTRQMHNFDNGRYTLGRHGTYNNFIPTNKAHIIWLGYFPINDNLLKRKLQIQQNIPQSDKDAQIGFQHLFDKDKILSINNEKSTSGLQLKFFNLPLYNLLNNGKLKNFKIVFVILN